MEDKRRKIICYGTVIGAAIFLILDIIQILGLFNSSIMNYIIYSILFILTGVNSIVAMKNNKSVGAILFGIIGIMLFAGIYAII